MKRSDKRNRIFGPSGCISEEGISLYLKNQLPAKEKNLLEQHLAGCLLCNEAMEAYEKFYEHGKTADDLFAIKSSLKSTYSNKTANKRNSQRTLITTLSIAASIILIFTGYYFINLQTKNENKEISYTAPKNLEKPIVGSEQKNPQELINQPAEKTSVKEDKTKSIPSQAPQNADYLYKTTTGTDRETSVAATGTAKVVADEAPGYFADTPDKKEEYRNDIYAGDYDQGLVLGGVATAESKADTKNAKAVNQEIAVSSAPLEAEKAVSEKDLALESYENAVDKVVLSGKKTARKEVSRSQIKTPANTALSYYYSGQYKKAIPEFNKKVARNSQDYESIYYLAMSYYYEGQKDAALPLLDTILKKNSNPYYDLALWQKAIILTEKKQTAEARTLLNELVDRGGNLKNDALQKLDELDKAE
ncbi:MAG TPA: tetratricopeptide repeat protein [Bacteroidales bacterium]|nr:tetratricopeptide repeat protein [Bacteroidales bacterium]